jgi:hypothetical protein
MINQTDLFGEEREVVKIKDNGVLEKACNRLLQMTKYDPELLNGNTMGEIDRRIFAEILWEDCFQNLIKPERKQIFIDAMLKAPEQDVYTRARRELLSRDLIRVSSEAIKSGERYRARIAGAMK